MKRTILALAVAASAAFAPFAPASALPEPCGDTFQPECDTCVTNTDLGTVCVPFTWGPSS